MVDATNNALLAGDVLQFTDFTVNSGITLNVSSGTIIRCTGAFTNNGTIIVAPAATPGNAAFSDTSGSSSGFPPIVTNIIAGAGCAEGPAGNGLAGTSTTGFLSGAPGAAGLGPNGKYLQVHSPLGGGGGGGSGIGFGGQGGGAFEVIAQGAITIGPAGSITANGGSGTTGTGGGAGGLVVLVSGTSITATAANSINTIGGAGGTASNAISGGGGGGGGIIHLYAPTISVPNTTTSVLAGASAASVTITATVHGSGGGGGSLGGAGAPGGNAILNTASGVTAGQAGNVFQSLVTDPSSLF